MAENTKPLKKNPSRKSCEKIIERILMTEILEKGRNQQFKNAADFMPFFESLYPASPSLSKQVQRAIHQMGLPKDRNGYFIINKTEAQLEEDQEISHMLSRGNASLSSLETETVFLKLTSDTIDYLFDLIHSSESFKGLYITMLKTSDGILFLTDSKARLNVLIESLIEG
ncbi:MAG: hypothetical protein K5851_02980 [Lachnospiraceae bacterium]|nr:hypothetical protein [Lachnospiraceae bacterium]